MSAAYCLRRRGRVHVGEDHAHLEAEEAVHPAHPLGVALGQVVVDRDDVHALAGQGVEVGREHAGQRLALTGPHLGDVAQVQRRRAHELDVEVPLAEGALGRLARGGEGFGKQVVERLPVGVPLPELVGHGPQLGVAHRDEVVLDGVDLLADPLQLAQESAFARAKDAIDDRWHCSSRSSRSSADDLTSLMAGGRNRFPFTAPTCHRRRDGTPNRVARGRARSVAGVQGPAGAKSRTSRRIIGALTRERSLE